MIIHDVEQGSQEWLQLRHGKMTASHAQAIQAAGKGLNTYIYSMMAEEQSKAIKVSYTNEHMERGIDLEDQARCMYELDHDVEVQQVGFIEMNEYFGGSPDGLVGDDGGIEIKCHNDAKHLEIMINRENGIEKKYWWQIQMNLLITDRKWWDYIAYNPNMKKESMVVMRIYPDQQAHEKLLIGMNKGIELIQHISSK